MNDDEKQPPRGILFLLADGSPWAEMRCLGWDVVDAQNKDDPPFEMIANIVIPKNPRLH